MVFSSLAFIIVFLPLLLLLFFAVPKQWGHARQYILLFFSLLFYGSGEPVYILLILSCVFVTWFLSSKIGARSKVALTIALLVNILPLIITKYAVFLIENVNAVFRTAKLAIPAIAMPIGISFYTFQMITYIVDLYRGTIRRQRNILLFALYIMFFPQLIAGPIVKYSEVERELEKPDVNWDRARFGAGRFVIGLGKKVLIANQAGFITAAILSCTVESLSAGMAWLCILAYTIQIYFDFSGYSEMAIGLGAIFGFHFPENFRDPYTSLSITDFWRRWHVTLGRFFREYVYIPLGGNRVNRGKWILNLITVWTLTGLWHGASWNFVLWGIYYCTLIIAEKIIAARINLPKIVSWLITFIFVMFGWGIFLCDGFSASEMFAFWGRLVPNRDVINPVTVGSLKLWGYLPFLIAGAFFSTPIWVTARIKLTSDKRSESVGFAVMHDVLYIAVFLASLLFLIGNTYNPFIYFRF